MDFIILMAKGVGAAVSVGLLLVVIGPLLFRKPSGPWRMSAGVLAVTIGFLAGALVFWGWPGFWPAEAWQMAYLDALVLAILGVASTINGPALRWSAVLLAIAAVTAITVREKLTPRDIFLPLMPTAMLLYTFTLHPSVREPRLWLTAGASLFLSIFAAVLVVMLYVDQNTGRMLILLCAMAGVLIGAGAIRPLRDAVRGGVTVLAILFAAVLGLAAFYNYALPATVFVLIACGPTAAATAWLPWLRRRPLTAAIVTILTTLAITIPAVLFAIKNAPAFE
jgi:hypothetical protein